MTTNEFNNLTDSQKAELVVISFSGQGLSELPDLSKCTELISLFCYNNQLKELPDLSKCKKLSELYCSNNQLKELPDLSKCKELRILYCYNNELTSLPDLSKCTKLRVLYCENNQLVSLPDLSKCTKLERLHCHTNPLHNFIFSEKIGSRNDITEYDVLNDTIQCGCFRNNLDAFEKKVRKHHDKNLFWLKQYIYFINQCKTLRNEKKDFV